MKLKTIPLDAISPSLDQPRYLIYSIDELLEKVEKKDPRIVPIWERLSDLASSILRDGLQQPITVYQDGDKYIIFDGHRRWLTMQFLHQYHDYGDGTIPCYIRAKPMLEQDSLLGQLSVNMQREDLNIFELARSLRQVHAHLQEHGGSVPIVSKDGTTHSLEISPGASPGDIWSAIEKMVGIGQSRRYQIEAVLKLPLKLQERAEEVGISEGKLRLLRPIKDEAIQMQVLDEILNQKLSDAEIRQRIQALQNKENSLSDSLANMPRPVQIESALKPIKKVAAEMRAASNIPNMIGKKDPRTVARYRDVIPELRKVVDDIYAMLDDLAYLEEG